MQKNVNKSILNLDISLTFCTFAIVDRAQRNKPNQLAKRSIYV